MATPGKAVEGKVVLVTGAGRGIGRAIAMAMAAEGARVVVNDLGVGVDGAGGEAGPAEQTADDIRAAGGAAVANTDSVADWDGAHRMVAQALDNFGRIDAVVNNAAILRDAIFHKMTREDWDLSLSVILSGSFYVSRAAAPHFRAQEAGAYVHVASTSGLIGGMGQANYGAAKLGLQGLSKAIAIDMARFNVRSNIVAPTAFTRMTESIPTQTSEQRARAAARRTIPAERNAPIVVYLASDLAAHVSGQIFYTRDNELVLFSQPRPVRQAHTAEGWTPQTIADHVMPVFAPNFVPLDRTRDVFKGYLP
ncbi:SDR family oxidoreductase [Silicimonas algicola]|uniref:NAD(P)-dependent dehydrogenase (Short-subunit alcohol dehydrogenase family) n=1 Tax=Silicimonas algicola TaxID=1826607 RepID=A0A316G2G6_9RHOB|nr:SDR family oxidoreductase [Silicimonas algicola]AZQ68279.1 SDR family oxidoreductase [Silicimonas algicola]PWK54585.1 NAD(P)-dependent dehydrogenase (short-subunit alcohol dehydrogenase family) [Silicimonas algicola]